MALSHKKSVSEAPLEERIEANHGAKIAFRRLLACPGVDKDELLFHLVAMEYYKDFGFAKWDRRSTLTKRGAKRLAQKVRGVRDEIGAFLTPAFRRHLTVDLGRYLWLNLVQKHLTMTAAFIEAMLQVSDDRAADDSAGERRRFTNYVLRVCGKPHDSEVAELIAVVLGFDCTAEDQRKFRTRQRKTGHN